MEEDSPSSRATESSFVRRPANFGNVSPFLVGATNIFSELIHPFLKLLKCVLKQQPHILHSSSPRSRHRLCRRATTSTHFFYLPENTRLHREKTLKTALKLLHTAFTTRFEAKCRQ